MNRVRWLTLTFLVLATLAVDAALFLAVIKASMSEHCDDAGNRAGWECWGWLQDGKAVLVLIVIVTAVGGFAAVKSWQTDSSQPWRD